MNKHQISGDANTTPNIRKERETDTPAIRSMTQRAFKTAPHASHTEQWIIDALRRSNHLTVSLVAEMEGKIIGHIAISPVTISSGATNWYGLGPISVLPEHQNQGV